MLCFLSFHRSVNLWVCLGQIGGSKWTRTPFWGVNFTATILHCIVVVFFLPVILGVLMQEINLCIHLKKKLGFELEGAKQCNVLSTIEMSGVWFVIYVLCLLVNQLRHVWFQFRPSVDWRQCLIPPKDLLFFPLMLQSVAPLDFP